MVKLEIGQIYGGGYQSPRFQVLSEMDDWIIRRAFSLDEAVYVDDEVGGFMRIDLGPYGIVRFTQENDRQPAMPHIQGYLVKVVTRV